VSRLDEMIDAMVETIRERLDVDRLQVEEGITGFTLSRNEVGSIDLAFGGRGLGHGPIPIPHTCHYLIKFCWPHPDNPDVEVCIEIEIPWPCPDEVGFA
jgi:hypothetical protein